MRELIEWNLCTTVNSDDPPFFGGYVNENYEFWMEALGLCSEQLYQLARNSIEASFQAISQKEEAYKALQEVAIARSQAIPQRLE